MNRGVDYSKWDRMNYDTDDEEVDSSSSSKNASRPRVTRLDKPSSVTCSRDGTLTITSSPPTDTASSSPPAPAERRVEQAEKKLRVSRVGANADRHDDYDDLISTSTENRRADQEEQERTTTAAPSSERKMKSSTMTASPSASDAAAASAVDDHHLAVGRLTKNGGQYIDPLTSRRVYWCQDHYEVTISVEYNPTEIYNSRDIRVRVEGALKYEDRNVAVGGGGAGVEGWNRGRLTITAKDVNREWITLLDGGLPHYVHLNEDVEDDNEEEVDWEIDSTTPGKIFQTSNDIDANEKSDNEKRRKLIRVTLRKAAPMSNVIIWWNKPLLSCPEEIDVTQIQDRRRTGQNPNSESSVEKMKEVWDEAHRIFREKIKSKKEKVPVTAVEQER